MAEERLYTHDATRHDTGREPVAVRRARFPLDDGCGLLESHNHSLISYRERHTHARSLARFDLALILDSPFGFVEDID